MATVVTVHGTFAHITGPTDGPTPAELQWWQPESATEAHLRELVDASDGPLTFTPFAWSGDNSEKERRRAGSRLLALLRTLEERNESYCLVAHSHGGSVIASALVESVARGQPLQHLKKWITVGAPFVQLRKERFLFTRLSLPRKVVFVASLMLLMMFLFYLGAALLGGDLPGRRQGVWDFAFSAGIMSLPFIVFYVFLKILDARTYFAYRPSFIEEARKLYMDRWVPLVHEDDEAVQGLRLLPKVKLHLFDRGFAVPMLTLVAIVALPLGYLFVVTSPPIMVAIADLLKSRVYDVEEYRNADAAINAARQQMRGIRGQLRQARKTAETAGLDPTRAEAARQEVRSLRAQLRQARENLSETHPEYRQVMRAQRFRRRFLQENGSPCPGETLCGGGTNYRLNSALLYHIVTDQLTATFVDDDLPWGHRRLLRVVVPAVLLPIIFALLALGILMIIQFVARHLSSGLSRVLNRMTRHEITRSALGNDTEGEIALGADGRPAWLSVKFEYLPAELGERITDYSNEISFASLTKFRNAISTVALAKDQEGDPSLISSYLTWRELIHTGYFEVPEFRKLLAYSLGQAEGFAARQSFESDPDFVRAQRWYGAVQPQPVD